MPTIPRPGVVIADAAKGTPRCQWRSAATSVALNHSHTVCDVRGGADQAQLIDLDKHVSLHASCWGIDDSGDDSSSCATWCQNLCDIQSYGGSTWSGSSGSPRGRQAPVQERHQAWIAGQLDETGRPSGCRVVSEAATSGELSTPVSSARRSAALLKLPSCEAWSTERMHCGERPRV